MRTTNLIKLLQALDKDEFRRFKKFLGSPYFNSNVLIVKLYESLKPFYPEFDSPKLTQEKIFAKLFPDLAYDNARLRNLISKLYGLTKDYLIQIELERDNFEKRKILKNACGQRHLFSFFEKETAALTDELNDLPYKDIHNYNREMWLKYDYYFHPLTKKYKSPSFDIQDVMSSLDRLFVLAKLQFASEMKNLERIVSKEYQIQFLEESNKFVRQFSDENPVFLLSENILKLFDSKTDEAAYRDSKEILIRHFEKLSKDDQIFGLLNLRNYLIRNANEGKKVNKEIFEIYKLGLELDIIVENNQISRFDFDNIVHAGCREKKFDWVKSFIKNHEKFLARDIHQDTLNLSLGTLSFHMGAFNESIDFLGKHQFSNLLQLIKSKALLIKNWFELFNNDLSYYDLLSAQLEAFEKFIRRNTLLSDVRKENYLNFILTTKQLTELKISEKSAPQIKNKLFKYINNREKLISKNWLLEKIEQL